MAQFFRCSDMCFLWRLDKLAPLMAAMQTSLTSTMSSAKDNDRTISTADASSLLCNPLWKDRMAPLSFLVLPSPERLTLFMERLGRNAV